MMDNVPAPSDDSDGTAAGPQATGSGDQAWQVPWPDETVWEAPWAEGDEASAGR